MQQTTNTILMVRPVNFRMNEQTAVNNYYQQELSDTLPAAINAKAQKEFDDFVVKLKTNGIEVIVVNDTENPNTPDSIFPNNWISFHENGDVVLYPMFAENRRLERREDVLDILEKNNFNIENIVDYSEAEEEEFFLEGTGSMILDRENRKAYCAISPRAEEELFIEFCEDFEFTPVVFTSNQTVNNQREAIYHTNVMMCVAEQFAIVCLASIDDKKERKNVIKHLKENVSIPVVGNGDIKTVKDAFKMFATNTKGSEKLGVGLSYSKRIIDRHGGKIWLKENSSTGITVYFTIPGINTPKI